MNKFHAYISSDIHFAFSGRKKNFVFITNSLYNKSLFCSLNSQTRKST